MPTEGSVLPIDINEEVKKSYMDYAMSVIVGRALPDVRSSLCRGAFFMPCMIQG